MDHIKHMAIITVHYQTDHTLIIKLTNIQSYTIITDTTYGSYKIERLSPTISSISMQI